MGDALLDRLEPRYYPEVAWMMLSRPVAGWEEARDEDPSGNPGAFAKHLLLPRS